MVTELKWLLSRCVELATMDEGSYAKLAAAALGSFCKAVLPLIRSNAEFSDVYRYYTTRQKNPLKGKQAVIAVGCKLIRIFYTLLTKGVDYDASRMRLDIIRPADGEQVA